MVQSDKTVSEASVGQSVEPGWLRRVRNISDTIRRALVAVDEHLRSIFVCRPLAGSILAPPPAGVPIPSTHSSEPSLPDQQTHGPAGVVCSWCSGLGAVYPVCVVPDMGTSWLFLSTDKPVVCCYCYGVRTVRVGGRISGGPITLHEAASAAAPATKQERG